jgi:CRP/FNR family transcriptional regulator, cyclic AMP receptor protein
MPVSILPFSEPATVAIPKHKATHQGWVHRLGPEDREAYCALEHEAYFEPRVTLFREDEASTHLFRIVDGQVKISVNSSTGRRLAVAVAGAGELLDLSSVVTGHPYCVTTETVYPSLVARVSSEKFIRFLMPRPTIFELLLGEMAAQYNLFCDTARLLGLDQSVPRRLARLLLYWCDSRGKKAQDGVRINVAMTHEEIGEFVGASRETITRTFSGFRERKLVEIHGSTIIIPNPASLAHFVAA